MTYNPDIHHRRSIRLNGFDYASTNAYFVSICSKDRECLFGQIQDNEMWMNEAGRMVATVWRELPGRFPHVSLDELVVMPNHLHGIILLDDRRGEPRVRPNCRGNNNQGDHKDRPYGTGADSLGRILQAFKFITTVEYIRGVEQSGWPPFAGRLWHRNYYDRIIRDDHELAATRDYIHHNPLKWEHDRENQANHP